MINEETANNYFNQIMNKLKQKDEKITSEDIKKAREVGLFIKNNPKNISTIEMLNIYASHFEEGLSKNYNFIKILTLNDNYKYYKTQEIFKNLPFLDSNNIFIFNALINDSAFYGSIPNYYKGILWLLDKHGLIIENDKKIIEKYVCDNKEIFKFNPQKYGTLEEEIQYHKDSLNKKYGPDFDDFTSREMALGVKMGNYYDEDIAKITYGNKKLGNIAEIYVFNCMKNIPNATFVARDLGDGFGYDIYCTRTENDKIEVLIEVKAKTVNDINDINSNNEFIALTDNEYKVMRETLERDNAEYYVFNCFINTKDYSIKNIILKAIDAETLMDDSKKEIYVKKTDSRGVVFTKQKQIDNSGMQKSLGTIKR